MIIIFMIIIIIFEFILVFWVIPGERGIKPSLAAYKVSAPPAVLSLEVRHRIAKSEQSIIKNFPYR